MQRMATDYDHLPLMKKVEVGIIISMSHFLLINWTLIFILFFHCIIYSFKLFLLHLIAVKEIQSYPRNQFFKKGSHVKYTFLVFQSTCLKAYMRSSHLMDLMEFLSMWGLSSKVGILGKISERNSVFFWYLFMLSLPGVRTQPRIDPGWRSCQAFTAQITFIWSLVWSSNQFYPFIGSHVHGWVCPR